ncbi:MAG: hypothetical protein NZ902_04235 [Acidilobaceae archaeon]|nr:hypothetical protein [Acidilobaceae archaeon]MCX8165062.1 hypothetical protein [Acidilobaceae archaeon]MDW7974421.1 hypothetical protein [Sulfolobales archaeon]
MDIFTVIMLALIDSVDPCIFALYLGILASLATTGIRAVLTISASFILGVFVGYFSFGLLLKNVLTLLSIDRRFLALVLMLYGLLVIYTSLPRAIRPREARLECRQDDLPCRLASAMGLYGASPRNSLVAGILGFVTAITLLPCTSGMYVVYNVLMQEVGLMLWILYTFIYNFVFVLPLILISAIFVLTASIPTVSLFIISRTEQVKVLGGVIAILVSLYILWTYYYP